MMLVIATNARMKVMYAFVRDSVLFSLNVDVGSPPPRIAASSSPYEKKKISAHPHNQKPHHPHSTTPNTTTPTNTNQHPTPS